MQRHRLTFPNGYDGDGRIARAYGFVYQPWWAVITKDAVLLRASRGPTSEEDLASTVRTLVAR